MHESMQYDVVIVGAGPSGLAAAIRLKQQAKQELSVCVIEKAAQIGAHQLSGAVLEPASLQMLLPEAWQNAPLDTPVNSDRFYFMSKSRAWRLPTPRQMKNEGNYDSETVHHAHFGPGTDLQTSHLCGFSMQFKKRADHPDRSVDANL